jgi:hypothetical protein
LWTVHVRPDCAPVATEITSGRKRLRAPRVRADADGDYPIHVGSAVCYVRLLGGLPPAVRVFSPILRDVSVTAELRAALDEINGRIRNGRVFTSGRAVVVVTDLPAIGLTAEHVSFACRELGALADHLLSRARLEGGRARRRLVAERGRWTRPGQVVVRPGDRLLDQVGTSGQGRHRRGARASG